jgi:hypothetical protein
VTAEARRALTEPVLSNWDHIEQELAEGSIDETDLRIGLEDTLREAANLAIEQKFGESWWRVDLEESTREVLRIEEATAREVVKTRCPYLLWC